VLTGGRGTDQLHHFYREWFVPSWPEDVEIEPLSRSVGPYTCRGRIHCPIHPHARDALLVTWSPPTGRRVEVPHVVIMGFEDGKVAYEHIYWDQASLLIQIGLLDEHRLPVVGSQQA
jgi:carboxymethylenebutenolidase